MVIIRAFRPDDIDAYVAIQETAWDETMAAAESKLAERFRIFPDGLFVAEHGGKVVGCATFIRIPGYDELMKPSWEDLTDNGWCSTHVEDGTTLFGVDLSVAKGAPRLAAPLLFMSAMEFGMSLGVDAIIWGGRMPRYHKYAETMSPEEYLFTRTRSGRYLDPEVHLYSRIPGIEIRGVIPEYFKDFESLNNGVLLRWANPIARFPFLRPFSRQVTGAVYRLSRGSRRRRAGSALTKR
jgi:hypothetical protein